MRPDNQLKLNEINFALFAGLSNVVLKLDLKFLNVEFRRSYDDEFYAFLKTFVKKNKKMINFENKAVYMGSMIRNRLHRDAYYTLFPIDYGRKVSFDDIRLLEQVLLIMFPDDFHFVTSFTLTEADVDTWILKEHSYGKYSYNEQHLFPRMLGFKLSILDNVNKFIRIAFDKLKERPFYQLAVDSYIHNFYQTSIKFCYITLFIALESLADAQTEITHRISRNVALLLSTDKSDGDFIYKKVKKLYDLRSKIVHGDKKATLDKIKPAYIHLRLIVSLTLMEVLAHNFKDAADLADRINMYGYGESSSLTDGYLAPEVRRNDYKLLLEKLS